MAYPWRTDFYIDAAAVGTNSGDTPTNAATALGNNSVFTSNGSIQVWAWVRRTHIESLTSTSNIGPNNDSDRNKSHRHFIIGWPNSGDPFYDERPAAGIAASWDLDTNPRSVNQLYGYNFPTLIHSRADAGGAKIWTHTNIYNFNFDNVSTGGRTQGGFSAVQSGVYMDNIVFTNNDGPMLDFSPNAYANTFGRMHFISSGGAAIYANSTYIEEMVIHSLSIINSGAIRCMFNGAFYARRVYNYSNSVDYLINAPATDMMSKGPWLAWYIERVAGVKPYSGYRGFVGPQQNSTFEGVVRVDDYFGEGPISNNGVFGPHMRLCSSAEAIYAGNRAVIAECNSWGGGWPTYGVAAEAQRPVRKLFNVTSGGTITIFQPIYVDSTGVFSLANGTVHMWLGAMGCKPQVITQSHVLVGTVANWSGTKKGGGTAYTIARTFTPTETVNALYECSLPTLQLSAQLGLQAYCMFGEPWAV